MFPIIKFTICSVTTNKCSDEGTVQNDGYTIVIFSLSTRSFSLLTLSISYHTPFTYSSLSRLTIVCQLNGGVSSGNMNVDTCLTVIREVHNRWINELFLYLKGRPDDIRKGLVKSRIPHARRSDHG